jgi:hypothetical protein
VPTGGAQVHVRPRSHDALIAALRIRWAQLKPCFAIAAAGRRRIIQKLGFPVIAQPQTMLVDCSQSPWVWIGSASPYVSSVPDTSVLSCFGCSPSVYAVPPRLHARQNFPSSRCRTSLLHVTFGELLSLKQTQGSIRLVLCLYGQLNHPKKMNANKWWRLVCRVTVCYVSFPIRLEGLVRTGHFTAQCTLSTSHSSRLQNTMTCLRAARWW